MDTVLTVIKENGKHRFVSCAEAVFFVCSGADVGLVTFKPRGRRPNVVMNGS
ncbi:hypothetical protein SAMN05518683_12927 [Salibacterium halotolerans]|uniref:Uncharacterized protein n=1 Tax=Salibacterium halotolerans TaxID=1884432 RepID=A0A1I5XLM9_9BACI|nr:hypothetical protein SAMN05518683_12927 [Salibacterium halotolerans]